VRRPSRPSSVLLAAVAAVAVVAVSAAAPAPAAGQRAEASPGELLDPGVSRALATHRATTLSDVAYEVSFDIPSDVDEAIRGTVSVQVRRSGDGPLILDFADPSQVAAVRVDGAPARWRAVADHIVVEVPSRASGPDPEPGDAERTVVAVDFTAGNGPLNRRDGFLYTLFVPDRAREALPVFDQPDLKARFRLRLTVPAEWRAVANGEVEAREERGDRVVYRFQETEPLPTYLFSFVAGRFTVEEARRDGRRIRLYHRETDSAKVARNLDALFDLHASSLRWLEAYTGIEYPFGKFDFVAIPSFQYNGMEHPGAILYRASSLFLDESATRNQELGRASVIAHETAHMWFGDLVTMPWFDDVWMKEVFANFMAAKMVNPSFPEVDHDLRFLLAHYPAAYGVDRTPGANPIRQPLGNLADAGSLYGAIIYQKAPIVMRQLERLTGADAFRAAVRRYLTAHAFGNAGWPDLVAFLDDVAELDVPAWSRVWIEEPGRPRIDVDATGRSVVLTPSDPAGRGRVWPQRTAVARWTGQETVPREVTLAGEAVQVEPGRDRLPGAGPVLPTAEGLGYGLFVLDPVTRDLLLAGLERVEPPVARASAWLTLHELMLEGDVAPPALLDVAARLVAVETDELVAQRVLGDLVELFWRFVPDAVRQRRAGELETLLWGRVQAVDGASRKAAYFNAWRDIASTPAAVARMRDVWSGAQEVDGLPLSERDRTTLALHLAVREADGVEEILATQRDAIENPDRRARFDFVRPAVSPSPAVRDSFFAALADPASRSREEWVVTALSFLHHPLRARQSIHYLEPGLELLREVRETGDIFFPTNWLGATLGGHASPAAAEIVRSFISRQEGTGYPPRLMGKLLQEADPLFRAVALRAAYPSE
jgi:aminopeptidase N